MRREILPWFSTLVFLCLLALSACESTSVVPKAVDHGPQKKEKQLKDAYNIMTKSSRKEGNQRTYGKMHAVHHLKVSQKTKGTQGGASDLNRPKTSYSAASSFLGKPPTSLFSAVFRRVTIGWFIFALY
ncbi:PREDICTED: uncharacterized protein LOC101293123 [Fragaria vesca subsp. vesca]|uniref:uncharacterized protein LOC101293123 n=1 Tax=Fragaria vesca subsp. vesca TaxID=101020 RepID=UPI0002C3136A|nr:PREDICTED: uncharacterized protein LOC101293123 [Fragaria vesca subsp. vesca]